MKENIIRYAIGSIFAIIISGGLFYFMHYLISGDMQIIKGDDVKYMNFIRVKHEKPIERKKRVLPKEPKPKKQPPKPKININKAKIVQQDININRPKLDIVLDLANDGLDGVSVRESLQGLNSGIAINLMPIFKFPPRFPNRAKMLRIKEGVVKVEFTITKDGVVESIKVVSSKPKKIFDSSAISAISKWKFKPKIVDGKAVSQRAIQIIEYKLDK